MTRQRPDPELERRLRAWLHETDAEDESWQPPVDRALVATERLPQRRSPWARWGWSGTLARAGGAAAAAAAAVVIAVAVTGMPRTDVGGPPTPGPDRTPHPAVPAADRLIGEIGLLSAVGTAIDERAIWAVSLDGFVVRHDRTSGAELSRTRISGNGCGPIVFGAGSAWTRACQSGPGEEVTVTWLAQLDPRDGSLVREIRFEAPIGFQPAFIDGSAWIVGDLRDGELATVDPASGEVEARLSVGGRATHVLAAAGRLWVSLPDEGRVARIDPASGDRTDVLVGGRPGSLAQAGGRVWVGSGNDATLDAIDPDRAEVVATLLLGGATGQLVAAGDGLWALTSTRVERVDPLAGEVVDAIRVGTHALGFAPQFVGQTYALAVDDDLWYVPPMGQALRLSR